MIEANFTTTGTLITIGLSVLAFLASQSWGIGKALYHEHKLRKALRKEIEEASPWLARNLLTLECMVQLSCVDALANHCPAPIPVQVHAEHYPDIVLKLSSEEKVHVNAIYNTLYGLNKNTETIIELIPQGLEDDDKLRELTRVLDSAYRNSRKALLLIDLYVRNVKKLKALEASAAADNPLHRLEEDSDQTLMKLLAEAKLIGEDAIRKKHNDGAASPLDVAPTPPPTMGKFYFDTTGAKFKCIRVEGEIVDMIQLESQLGVVTYDLYIRRHIASLRHLYELTDEDETARLERRFLALKPRPVLRS
jgi:hypothetical protein